MTFETPLSHLRQFTRPLRDQRVLLGSREAIPLDPILIGDDLCVHWSQTGWL